MSYKKRMNILSCIAIVLVIITVAIGMIDDMNSRKLVVVDAFAPRKTTLEFTPEQSPSDEQKTVNINTATAEELAQFLPTIGEVKAGRIVEYRDLIGRFKSVDELIEVEGIGEKTLETIRPFCRVDD